MSIFLNIKETSQEHENLMQIALVKFEIWHLSAARPGTLDLDSTNLYNIL